MLGFNDLKKTKENFLSMIRKERRLDLWTRDSRSGFWWWRSLGPGSPIVSLWENDFEVKSNKSFLVSLLQAGYFHYIEPFQFAVSDPIAGKKHKYLEGWPRFFR